MGKASKQTERERSGNGRYPHRINVRLTEGDYLFLRSEGKGSLTAGFRAILRGYSRFGLTADRSGELAGRVADREEYIRGQNHILRHQRSQIRWLCGAVVFLTACCVVLAGLVVV